QRPSPRRQGSHRLPVNRLGRKPGWQLPEQSIVLRGRMQADVHRADLDAAGMVLDHPAQRVGQQLVAVADAQNRQFS
ncbi:hypothetical protein RZS08_28680, partial [Arthrospira platensis SPKY1]|nr:hypothetical protein [Arthrospira platensis SPKY1]